MPPCALSQDDSQVPLGLAPEPIKWPQSEEKPTGGIQAWGWVKSLSVRAGVLHSHHVTFVKNLTVASRPPSFYHIKDPIYSWRQRRPSSLFSQYLTHWILNAVLVNSCHSCWNKKNTVCSRTKSFSLNNSFVIYLVALWYYYIRVSEKLFHHFSTQPPLLFLLRSMENHGLCVCFSPAFESSLSDCHLLLGRVYVYSRRSGQHSWEQKDWVAV